MKKRLLCMLLTVLMLVSLLPTGVLAYTGNPSDTAGSGATLSGKVCISLRLCLQTIPM